MSIRMGFGVVLVSMYTELVYESHITKHARPIKLKGGNVTPITETVG